MAQLDAQVNTFTIRPLLPVYPGAKEHPVNLPPNKTFPAGQVLGTVAAAVNAVQTLTVTGTPTGGTFTITVNLDGGSQTTAPIAYNASAAVVAAAVAALGYVGSGNVTGSGGALPGTAVVLTFASRLAGRPIPPMTVSVAGLTGGTPAASFAQTTLGLTAGTYDIPDDSAILAQVILKYPCATDSGGNVTYGTAANGGQWGETLKYATAYFTGSFLESELTSMTAGRLTAMGGHRISGVAGSGIITID